MNRVLLTEEMRHSRLLLSGSDIVKGFRLFACIE
jgi:hypothetical protein